MKQKTTAFLSSIINLILPRYYFAVVLLLLNSCAEDTRNKIEMKIVTAKSGDDSTTKLVSTIFIAEDSSLFLNDGPVNSFSYTDSLFSDNGLMLLHKGETKILIRKPTLLVQSDKQQTPFWVRPGERIHVKRLADNTTHFYIDNDSTKTNELQLFKLLNTQHGPLRSVLYLPALIRKVNNMEMLNKIQSQIDIQKKARLYFIDSFIQAHTVHEDLRNIAMLMVKYAAINDELLLFWKNKSYLKKVNKYDTLIKESIQVLNGMNFIPYSTCLAALNNAVSISTTNYRENFILSKADLEEKYNFIINEFTGIQKDYLLSQIINGAVSRQIEVKDDIIDRFKVDCKTAGYRNRIIANMAEKKHNSDINIMQNDKLLAIGDNEEKNLQTILSLCKGKVVLIDIWASWCVPCIKEIPFSHELAVKYGDKSVEFIYLSIEENRGRWLKSASEQKLDSANSFLLLNGGTSSFAKRFQINTIPRYILIGKDGKVIDEKAPRPSDPALQKLIDSALVRNN